MGGNAIKTHFGIESKRLNLQEFLECFDEVRFRLYQNGIAERCDYVKFYVTKPDHGDIDIVVALEEIPKVNQIEEVFQTKYVFRNGNVFSLLFRETQADLIFVPLETYKANLNFRNFSPFGNIFSRLLKQLDVSWKVDGLYYTFRYKDFKKNILLTRDFNEILLYGFEDQELVDQYGFFRTQEDVFEFVTKSPYFRKEIYYLENLNHINRKRDAVRKDYGEWNDYILGKEDKLLRVPTTEENLNRIARAFPHVLFEVDKAYLQVLEQKEQSLKFNGNLVRLWTGLEGKELGETIADFKKVWKVDIGDLTAQEIEKIFKQYWESRR